MFRNAFSSCALTPHLGCSVAIEPSLSPKTSPPKHDVPSPSCSGRGGLSLSPSSSSWWWTTTPTSLQRVSSDLNTRVDALESVAEVQYLVRQAIERARRRRLKRREGCVWLSIQPRIMARSLLLYSAISAGIDVFCFDPMLEYLGLSESDHSHTYTHDDSSSPPSVPTFHLTALGNTSFATNDSQRCRFVDHRQATDFHLPVTS